MSDAETNTVGRDHVLQVEQIYDAFDRGDVDWIVDQMVPDVAVEHHPTGNTAQDADVPYMRRRTGRDGARAFFTDIHDDFEMDLFRPHTFLAGGSQVAAVIEYHLVVRSTGREVHDEEIHLWQFDDAGRVASLRHFLDTAKAIEAHATDPRRNT